MASFLQRGLQRRAAVAFLVAGIWIPALRAQQAQVHLKPNLLQRYAKLDAQAQRQTGHKRAETLAQLADLDFTFANASYRQHDLASGRRYLQQTAEQADEACALLHAAALRGDKSGIKNVEKEIQKITFGLRGLDQAVDFSEQAEVGAAVDHFTNLNYELLQWLFAPKPSK
ncbi:MAG: hypothetical protein ACRD1Y_14860 [Terriglobales bacterium]